MEWCAVILLSFFCCYAKAAQPLGGNETSIEDYPYVVQVQYKDMLKCVGIIVDEENIVSVAHCFFDRDSNQLNSSSFTVRYGTSELKSGGTVVNVTSITIHEDYNTPVRDNDIAVLKLSSPVTLGDNAEIATLPSMGEDIGDEVNVTILSWFENLNKNSRLREFNYSTISRDSCSEQFQNISTEENPYTVTENMFCVTTSERACPGKDGGPVVYNNSVNGLTSWGQGCGNPRYPLVNVNLDVYIDWINDTISKNKA